MASRPAIPIKSDEAPVRCPARIYNNRHRIGDARARMKERRTAATRYGKAAAFVLGVLDPAADIQYIWRQWKLVLKGIN